jgi:hypothetical protein
MTSSWQKLLGKICDLIFTVPLGSTPWPNHHFGPLLLGIYFPLSHHRPWHLCSTALLDNLASQLSELPPSYLNWGENILHNLLHEAWTLDTLSSGMEWHGHCYCANYNGEFHIVRPQDKAGEILIKDPEDEEHYLVTCDGDNLAIPYQCDVCHFINIMGKEPLELSARDMRFMRCLLV